MTTDRPAEGSTTAALEGTAHGTARPAATRRWPARALVLSGAALGVLVALGFASLMYGSITLSASEVWSGLVSRDDPFARTVVWDVRLPRVIAAAMVGGALGVAGCLLQGVTRNPLADPTILGVTAAAGLGSSLAIVIDPQLPGWGIAAAALAGGLVGAALLFLISWRTSESPARLALAGVALSALFGAAIVGLLSSSRTFLQTNLGFLAGGLYGTTWDDVRVILPLALIGLAGGFAAAGRLNILALGEDLAVSLGVPTTRTRILVLIACAFLTAGAVSVAGLVGFVGLVAPHLTRLALGSDNRVLIPASALTGAMLVMSADLVARVAIAPSELPMGIFTAAVGAPFLLYLLRVRP